MIAREESMIQFGMTFAMNTKTAGVFAPAICHMIAAAEEWLGPAFDPPLLTSLSIVARAQRSCVHWSAGRSCARVELAGRVMKDPRCLAFELAHECIHLFAPGPTNRYVTNLEEGLAVEFSMRYAAAQFGTDGWLFVNDIPLWGEYLAAWLAARRLLAAADGIIRRIRERQPVISYINADLIHEFASISTQDAAFLARPFPRMIPKTG